MTRMQNNMANLLRLIMTPLLTSLLLWGKSQRFYEALSRITRIIILSLLSSNQVIAYGAGNTIYVKREHGSKPSLLDRKFVFRQVSSATTNSDAQVTQTNLSAMHKQITPNITRSMTEPINHKRATQKPAQSKLTQKETKDPGSNNWNDFAVETELDESREVSAKLIAR